MVDRETWADRINDVDGLTAEPSEAPDELNSCDMCGSEAVVFAAFSTDPESVQQLCELHAGALIDDHKDAQEAM